MDIEAETERHFSRAGRACDECRLLHAVLLNSAGRPALLAMMPVQVFSGGDCKSVTIELFCAPESIRNLARTVGRLSARSSAA
jgi:hypothetical protein